MKNTKQLPRKWKWSKLGDLVNNLDGKRIPLSKGEREKRKGKYRYYGATDIVDYIDDYIFEGEYLLVGEDGANLLSKSKPLAFIVDGKFWVNNHAHVLQAKAIISNKYLCYYINSMNLSGFITGTAQPKLTQGNLNKIEIPFCSIEVQEMIVSKIEELFSELDKGIEQLKTVQQQLKTYRQAVLKWAFEGKFTDGITSNGELPKGWFWCKNKDLLKYVTSGSRDWKQYYSSIGARFIRTQDINTNTLDIDNTAFVDLPKKVEGKRSLVERGDLLMTITGANVGKVAMIDFDIPEAYVSQSVALLKYNDKKIVKFLWYYFQTQSFGKSFIENLVYGMGRPVLSLENMREVEVLMCPLEQQHKITEEIESRLSVADKLEEAIAQSLKQAESLRQSILKIAFVGRLLASDTIETVTETIKSLSQDIVETSNR